MPGASKRVSLDLEHRSISIYGIFNKINRQGCVLYCDIHRLLQMCVTVPLENSEDAVTGQPVDLF